MKDVRVGDISSTRRYIYIYSVSLSLDSVINHEWSHVARFSTSPRIFSMDVHPEEKVYAIKFNRSRGKYRPFLCRFFIFRGGGENFEIERYTKLAIATD